MRDREHTCVTKEKTLLNILLCKVGLFDDEFHANRAITFFSTQRIGSFARFHSRSLCLCTLFTLFFFRNIKRNKNFELNIHLFLRLFTFVRILNSNQN